MGNNRAIEFQKSVSRERLRNCALKLKTKNQNEYTVFDVVYLYRLYLVNELISKELRFILSQFEVLLRNNINKALISIRGKNWILDLKKQGYWNQDEINEIEKAERRIKILGKTPAHERILAKMTLGFWLRLFNNPYFDSLIKSEMAIIFPRNKQHLVQTSYGISKFRDSFKLVHVLRNKVSHQEFVISGKYRIKETHSELKLIMRMMDGDYYDHFGGMDHFDDSYESLKKLVEEIKNTIE